MAFPDIRTVVDSGVEVNLCGECGGIRTVGDWPDCRKSGNHAPGNFGEEPLQAYFDENITERGEYITTRGQRQKIMRENNLEYRKKRTDLLHGQRIFFDMGRGR